MSGKTCPNVTMRVKVGDREIEITGPSDFVEKKIAEFLEKQGQSLAPGAPGLKEGAGQGAGRVVQPPAHGGKAMSEAQFFRKVSAKTDLDRVLAAGYYLEKFKQVQNFTTAEIAETIRVAKIVPPKNPSDAVGKNIRKGTIMPSGDKDGRMAFVLTTDGEEAVEAALNAS